MERLSEQQLRFVQDNRDKRVRARLPVRAGQVAGELLKSGTLVRPAWRRRLLAVLEEYAGRELLDYAAVVSVRAGVLRLHVAEPGLMYRMRLAWEQRLLEVLRVELPEAGIHSIRFSTGAAPD